MGSGSESASAREGGDGERLAASGEHAARTLGTRRRILVVDDDDAIRRGVSRMLSEMGHDVDVAADAESAIEIARNTPPDLVLTDLNLPRRSGMDLIVDLQERGIEATLVVLTGHGSIDSAVEATRRGVYDYLVKPIDRERLIAVVRKGLERAVLRQEVLHLHRELARSGRLEEFVGKSPAMLEVYRLVEQVAPSSAPVLITGESGTGKEVIARAIHRLSPRAAARLVAINCAAIPDNLLESEIFGHEKGAFTGATGTRAGCFELADGGTLFLDEIGEMPVELQSKLLRVLEDGVVRRVGGTRETKVNVRVVAATNVAIDTLLARGAFREDLYYRLNVFTVALPPLRDRRDDIPLLAERFLAAYAKENNRALSGFSDEALALLTNYRWPGNVRELRNVVQRAVILCREGEIAAHHLPSTVRDAARTPGAPADSAATRTVNIPIGTTIDDAERVLILETLAACGGNKTRAAAHLAISAKTLYAKLHKYDTNAGDEP
ncbi:MAG: sigma-54-dependent transcriptional regulator [bacterium]